jgi:hypothetical protein
MANPDLRGRPPEKGERRGGRKKGIPNRATIERQKAVYATGIAPLEVMIDVMRWHYGRALEEIARPAPRDIDFIEAELDKAHDKARDAAPYVHPKLATLQSNVNLTGRLTLGELVRMSMPQLNADNEDAPMLDVTPNERVDEMK